MRSSVTSSAVALADRTRLNWGKGVGRHFPEEEGGLLQSLRAQNRVNNCLLWAFGAFSVPRTGAQAIWPWVQPGSELGVGSLARAGTDPQGGVGLALKIQPGQNGRLGGRGCLQQPPRHCPPERGAVVCLRERHTTPDCARRNGEARVGQGMPPSGGEVMMKTRIKQDAFIKCIIKFKRCQTCRTRSGAGFRKCANPCLGISSIPSGPLSLSGGKLMILSPLCHRSFK